MPGTRQSFSCTSPFGALMLSHRPSKKREIVCLSCAQRAEVAGVSIGTVYRYFPDRVAILDHLWPDRADTYWPDAE